MRVRIAVNLLWLIVISVAELSIDDGCMLWNIIENKLIFTCRTSDFSNPLSLIDNRGKEYARCRFEHIGNQIFRCTGRHETQIVSVDAPKKEVRFTIYEIESKDVDGIWTCAQGNRQFTNNVSKLNGIIGDTDIFIEAKFYEINNTKRVSLQCSACRTSRGYTVEFLINNTSEVSITYNPVTGSCTDENGECNPDICSCLLTGKKFNATFPFGTKGYVKYSCDMQFTDKKTSMIFSKTANMRSDGKDFEVMRTITTINKMPQATGGESILATEGKHDTDLETENVTVTHPVVPGDTPNENTGNVTKWVLIAIFSTVIAALLILIIAYFIYQKKNRKKTGNEQSDPGENRSLLEKSDTTETAFTYSTEKVSSFTTMQNDAGNYDGPAQITVSKTSMKDENEKYVGPVLSIDVETSTENGPVLSIDVETSTENVSFPKGQSKVTMTNESYLDTVQKEKKMEDMVKIGATKCCYPCSVISKLMEAFYWCLDCGNGLCINCNNIHRVMRNHTIVDIEKLPANYSLSFCCPQHKNQFLDYFCIDHDKLCCIQCRHDQHPNCTKIEHIDVLSKACRTSQIFTDYEDHLYVSRGFLTNTIRILSRNIDDIKEDCRRIIDLIATQNENESADEETHAIRFKAIEPELTNAKASCLNTLEINIANTKTMKAITDEQKLLFDFFEQNGSNKLLFLLINSTKHHLSERRAEIQHLCENVIHLSVHFNGYDEENPTVGCIEVAERIDEIFQSETNVQNPIGPATVSFEDELVISTTKIQDSLAVSNNGYLLVCSTFHLVIIILAEHGHTEEQITLLHTPKKISIIPDTDTAVLTCQSVDIIQFVDINGRKVKSRISVKGSTNCSIACTPEYILVGDLRKIMILDHDGNSIREIEIDVDLRTLFYFNERIYFTENHSKEIRCIGMNGDDIYRYQSKNVDSPISAIPNKEGHVFVLDRGPIELYKLSAYGRDIPLEVKGKADLNNARSICFNNDCTKLYVLKKGKSSSICKFKIGK